MSYNRYGPYGPYGKGNMNTKFTNFTVAIVALAVVSLAEKVASVIKVGMAGYPPVYDSKKTHVEWGPRRDQITDGEPGSDVEPVDEE
jgi:hypothetical protein